jgi:CRP-like cAMP-binding protein
MTHNDFNKVYAGLITQIQDKTISEFSGFHLCKNLQQRE